jgi:hypothetical protein
LPKADIRIAPRWCQGQGARCSRAHLFETARGARHDVLALITSAQRVCRLKAALRRGGIMFAPISG